MILFEILLLAGIAIYSVLLIYSWLKGAPYVPTQRKEIDDILKYAEIQQGMHFLELGCGDGRVTRRAIELYDISGKGIDVNPELIFRANFLAKRKKLKKAIFKVEDILTADFSTADIIYIYLFPALIDKIKNQLLNETKAHVIIISHGFKIPFLNSLLMKQRKGGKFSTYYYLKNLN
jgi:SAM-dependent methyltransferase